MINVKNVVTFISIINGHMHNCKSHHRIWIYSNQCPSQKNDIFKFCENKNYIKNLTKTNFEYFYIYEDKKHLTNKLAKNYLHNYPLLLFF